MPSLEIIVRNIDELRPRANNPRTHSKKQLEQIASSIQRFTFTNPVLVDADGRIIAAMAAWKQPR